MSEDLVETNLIRLIVVHNQSIRVAKVSIIAFRFDYSSFFLGAWDNEKFIPQLWVKTIIRIQKSHKIFYHKIQTLFNWGNHEIETTEILILAYKIFDNAYKGRQALSSFLAHIWIRETQVHYLIDMWASKTPIPSLLLHYADHKSSIYFEENKIEVGNFIFS